MDKLTFPTGAEVYDALMATIEPELMSANIPVLDDKYVGESEEEKAARYERYSRAFDAYDAAYDKWKNDMHVVVKDYKKTALKTAEAESRTKDASVLGNLESELSSAS